MQSRRPSASGGQQTRLPAIAPRYDGGPSLGTQAALGDVPSESRRNRLPPRSRSGCWTCRTRKVKCDEQRPACGQCVRLGHECDYNPRLSFRDDTPRIVERMQEVSIVGSSVWSSRTSNTETRRQDSEEDLLPPFQTLTTDEDREKKAEMHQPGTYHVITNPRSFASLPEYRDGGLSMIGGGQSLVHFGQDGSNETSGMSQNYLGDDEDPNTVILQSFDDTSRRGSINSFRLVTNAPSPIAYSGSLSRRPHSSHEVSTSRRSSTSQQNTSKLDIAPSGDRDAGLLEHYRRTLSQKIFKRERPDGDGDEDVFEIEAKTYPPLFHAIMALSELTLAHQRGVHTTDALEHYQQVIPALQIKVQSSEESYSDGAFFTHFILLLYEIAAALYGDLTTYWEHHSSQLLRIIRLRRQSNTVEPYEFIVWYVAFIDVYTLLSMGGTGLFTETLIKENLVPSPERCLPLITISLSQPLSSISTRSQAPSVFLPEEQAYFPSLIKLHQEVLLLAFRIGQQAREMRAEETQRRLGPSSSAASESAFSNTRRRRIQNLQNLIYQYDSTWNAQYPAAWPWYSGSKSLPPRVLFCIQLSYMLYRACVIYTHTSMFPSQLNDPMLDEQQIATRSREIIEAARMVLSEKSYEIRLVVFPLFMAGFATKDRGEKRMVLDLLLAVEQHESRGSTESIRNLLQKLYEKQRSATMEIGNANSVDWIEEIEKSGQRFII
ncbi:uncharacterized protein PAC_00706 [Phialocephala subalpina]|uniref:Zn(2)-C6 fungal-type domain-containing protein n=1 Tax=Phialocephala subalpina TaxID=576137 RepID=A0A1L7WDG7_9HELO|nr:uncharacterized protein PAC_00706 [Phialocephala subalpina]